MSEPKPSSLWAVVIGLIIAAFVVWGGVYYVSAGSIGHFWK